MFCAYNRTRYQVSAYRTIAPLVHFIVTNFYKFFIKLRYSFLRCCWDHFESHILSSPEPSAYSISKLQRCFRHLSTIFKDL